MANSSSNHRDSGSLRAQSTPDAPPLDVLFEVLAHQRRRYTLACLRELETPIALADLANEVASREQGTPIPDAPAEEVKQVYTSLYHSHVPKMADANIVEYSREDDTVSLSTDTERVAPFIELATPNE